MKDLSQMTLEELWQLFPIILKEHNDDYLKWYKKERDSLLELVRETSISRINHIGSTAVRGLIAKPTVDILLEINLDIDIYNLKELISSKGWILMHKSDHPFKSLIFNKGYTPNGFDERVYHLHVRNSGDWDELYFRDFLIDHPDIAAKYGELKLNLLEDYRHDRDGYTEAKSGFIKRETQRARKNYKNRYVPDK